MDKNSDNYLDETFNSIKNINDIAFNLKYLSETFKRLGNVEISNELSRYYICLLQETKNISNTLNEELNSQIKKDGVFIGNIFKSLATDKKGS